MNESFVTFVTLIRLHPGMNELMLGKVSTSVKAFPTLTAFIRSLPFSISSSFSVFLLVFSGYQMVLTVLWEDNIQVWCQMRP